MTKRVTVEELRETIESVIDDIEQGNAIDVVRDGRTIATIKPTVQIVQRGTTYPFRNFNPGPLPKNRDFDVVQMLIDEREYERSGKKYGL